MSLEARIAWGPGVSVICEHASRLVDALEAATGRGAAGIISFGVAGGLSPDLAVGDWVIGSGVRTEHERHIADQRWARRLAQALPGAVHGEIAGADRPVAHAFHKHQLGAQTGAAAVDMESHIAGRIAAARQIPFAICRTIIDPAHRDLPPAALVGLRHDGTPDVRAVARSVAGEPAQFPTLVRTAMDAWIARRALRRGRRFLGAAFACPYVGETAPELPMRAGLLEMRYLRSVRS
jgi:hopanoid-associated phosphorylase